MKKVSASGKSCTLAHLRSGQAGQLLTIGGERAYRRRLLELGLTPGTWVRVLKVAPLGDPLEVEVRGSRLSLRRAEAAQLKVSPSDEVPVPSLRSAFSFRSRQASAA